MPPSYQREGDGIRYFLKIIIDRKLFSFGRSCEVILPIAFLPRHSIPRLASDPYANLLEKAPAPSTAVLANFDETSTPLPASSTYVSVFLNRPLVYARGSSFDVRIKVACGDLKLLSKLVPASITVNLMRWGQVSPLPHPVVIASSNKVEFYPSDILPSISSIPSSSRNLECRAFTATIPLSDDLCPSFSMENGPRVAYFVQVALRLSKSVTKSVEPAVEIINCSQDKYKLAKEYYKRNAKGGMASIPK